MPLPKGDASRFSVLHIQDDSSSDENDLFSQKNQWQMVKGHSTAVKNADGKVQPKKKRGKKKTKPVAVMDADGVLVQQGEGDRRRVQSEGGAALSSSVDDQEAAQLQAALAASHIEYQRQRQLEQQEEAEFEQVRRSVLQRSTGDDTTATEATAKPATKPVSQSGQRKDHAKPQKQVTHAATTAEHEANVSSAQIETFAEITEQANTLLRDLASNQTLAHAHILDFYVDKTKQLCAHTQALSAQVDKLKGSEKTYKDRYKKLCQLLQDSELKEKIKLLLEVERGAKTQQEMGSQISELQVQLEQTRSRLHELEHARTLAAHAVQ